jgi:hypothetical protein
MMEILVWIVFWSILGLVIIVPLAIGVGGLALIVKSIQDFFYLFDKK